MSFKDFALLLLVCAIWSASNVVVKLVVAHLGAPPLFFAAVRFAIVILVTLPWLFPAPKPLWRLIAVGLSIGGGTFALLFIGLKTASPSASAIVGQLGVPITTLLSIIFLGERVRWRRGIGIVLTLLGAMVVIWDPKGFTVSTGLLFVAASALIGSIGTVLLKSVEGVKPLQFQAWVGFSSLWPIAALSLLLEHDQTAVLRTHLWPFIGGVLFTSLVVSVIAHTTYYGLIQRYEATLLQPLTLLAPLGTIALGVWITHDVFDLRMAIGSAVALAGVLIIAIRRNHVMPMILAVRNWAQ